MRQTRLINGLSGSASGLTALLTLRLTRTIIRLGRYNELSVYNLTNDQLVVCGTLGLTFICQQRQCCGATFTRCEQDVLLGRATLLHLARCNVGYTQRAILNLYSLATCVDRG